MDLIEQAEKIETNPSPSLGRKATGALFWNTAFLPLKALLGFVVAITIVQLFSRDSYAAYAIVTAFLGTLGMYVDLGIERALPRFVGEVERREGRKGLYRFILNITLVKLAILAIVILALVLFAPSINNLMQWGEAGYVYLGFIYALLILGALYDIAIQILFSFFKQKATNLLDIIVTILNPVLTLIFVIWFKLEQYGVLVALLITTVLCVIIAGWQAWRASQETAIKPVAPATDQEKVTGSSLKSRFIKYASLMYFFNISTSFYDASFAILILTAYQELTAVIIIRLVYFFIKTLLKTLLTPFVGVQTPLFSGIHAQNRQPDLQTAYSAFSKLQIIILVPSATGILIVSRNLLELLMVNNTNPQAVLPPTLLNLATVACILTVLFTFLESLISLPLTVLMIYEYYREVIISRLLPLLTVPLLLVSIQGGWGVIGAITIMGSLAVLSRVVALLFLQKRLRLRYPTKFLLKVLIASLSFGVPLGGLAWLLPTNWLTTFGIAISGVIIFYGVFKLLGGFDQEDKARITAMKLPLRKYIVKYL
jgi:O-antigen/teichoic acid export membrane protein